MAFHVELDKGWGLFHRRLPTIKVEGDEKSLRSFAAMCTHAAEHGSAIAPIKQKNDGGGEIIVKLVR